MAGEIPELLSCGEEGEKPRASGTSGTLSGPGNFISKLRSRTCRPEGSSNQKLLKLGEKTGIPSPL